MRGELLFSERLYAALLYLYPKEFRAVYGAQMRLTFRDACRATYRQNGVSGLLALWLPTMLDLLKSALEERARQGEITMSKTRLITLAGPLTILIGAMWLLVPIANLILRIGPARPEQDWDLLVALLGFSFFLSFAPMLFAVIGTRLRFRQSAGILGRLGLALSVAGCTGVTVFLLANLLLGGMAPGGGEVPWTNYAAGFCLFGIMIGYILFGMDALRYKLLPRWNLLPLLLGSTNLAYSLALDWFGVPAYIPLQWASPLLYFAITGTCWVLLGVAMMGQRQAHEAVAA